MSACKKTNLSLEAVLRATEVGVEALLARRFVRLELRNSARAGWVVDTTTTPPRQRLRCGAAMGSVCPIVAFGAAQWERGPACNSSTTVEATIQKIMPCMYVCMYSGSVQYMRGVDQYTRVLY